MPGRKLPSRAGNWLLTRKARWRFCGDCGTPAWQRLRVLHHPESTETADVNWVQRLIRHLDDGRLEHYGERETGEFLTDLAMADSRLCVRSPLDRLAGPPAGSVTG
jgi:hypothetical protein